MMNWGKRFHISRLSTRSLEFSDVLSHSVTDSTATINAHIPTNISRPTTFISVKERTAASSPIASAAANPAASANSDVPIHAPAMPAGSSNAFAANGRKKIMATAQTTTNEIAIDTCS